ncbi:NAD(P)-binding Rossmann-fold superfamily protein [Prunus dulcis]|uniref:NAD(P)-binding Rossmann-fold superfamily protein n=1 Tax=Prunus dulcis TaxID=3755 RepID=A0A4Y1RGU2_PRUDU|nr:NAD(P)-binding Rossmann-fold superfamily protein [Prunus dulcis]
MDGQGYAHPYFIISPQLSWTQKFVYQPSHEDINFNFTQRGQTSLHTTGPSDQQAKKMLETVKYLLGSVGGSGYGSRSTAEQVTESSPDLRHITAIITGATSGIGAETARVLAKRGARLVLPARSLKAAEDAKARIVSEFPDSEIIIMALDLSSLTSVRNFVSEFESLQLPLNLLINNAGKFAHEHAISEDGIEMTFATNYLEYLFKKIRSFSVDEAAAQQNDRNGGGYRRSRPNRERLVGYSRLVFGRYHPISRRDKPKRKVSDDYDETRAYALSKLGNVLHTKELARRLKEMDANVTVNCVHPGIVRTRLTENVKALPQAAATTCYVATHPRLVDVSGKYFADCNETLPSKLGSNLSEAARLWSASEIMVSKSSNAIFDPSSQWEY